MVVVVVVAHGAAMSHRRGRGRGTRGSTGMSHRGGGGGTLGRDVAWWWWWHVGVRCCVVMLRGAAPGHHIAVVVVVAQGWHRGWHRDATSRRHHGEEEILPGRAPECLVDPSGVGVRTLDE